MSSYEVYACSPRSAALCCARHVPVAYPISSAMPGCLAGYATLVACDVSYHCVMGYGTIVNLFASILTIAACGRIILLSGDVSIVLTEH